jgi:hypothetical protein
LLPLTGGKRVGKPQAFEKLEAWVERGYLEIHAAPHGQAVEPGS